MRNSDWDTSHITADEFAIWNFKFREMALGDFTAEIDGPGGKIKTPLRLLFVKFTDGKSAVYGIN